jgi:Cdc6-like AAA superfamily ATPase
METYRVALKEARAAFLSATNRLDQIKYEEYILNKDIGKLRRTITALAAMCSESAGFDDFGITDAVAEVMEAEQSAITSAGVVQRLEALGFDIASQKNASASVHAVLKRLATKGTITKETTEKGGIVWKGPKFDPEYMDIPF